MIVNDCYKVPVARRQRKVETSHRPLKFISHLQKKYEIIQYQLGLKLDIENNRRKRYTIQYKVGLGI